MSADVLAEEYEVLSSIFPDELESDAFNLSRGDPHSRCLFTTRQSWQKTS